jgi:MATE family multidrug resistance protein
VRLFTSDDAVVETCRRFLPWLLVMPPLGCAAFTWDGIYLGATASRSLFLSMAVALLGFFATWFGWRWLGGWAALTGAGGASAAGMVAAGTAADICLHVLLAAYFVHLAARTVCLSLTYRRDILSKVSA